MLTKNEESMLILMARGKIFLRVDGYGYMWSGAVIRVTTPNVKCMVCRLHLECFPAYLEGDYNMYDFFEDFLSPTEAELFLFKHTFGIPWMLHKGVTK